MNMCGEINVADLFSEAGLQYSPTDDIGSEANRYFDELTRKRCVIACMVETILPERNDAAYKYQVELDKKERHSETQEKTEKIDIPILQISKEEEMVEEIERSESIT